MNHNVHVRGWTISGSILRALDFAVLISTLAIAICGT